MSFRMGDFGTKIDPAVLERDASVRVDGRHPDQLRPVAIATRYLKHADGSCLVEVGETRVVCAVSFEDRVPLFLRGKGEGWVTAEYGMLPKSSKTRINREIAKPKGRTAEIQRLIGRALRAVTDQSALGQRLVNIDCDVIQADGGTRTASITGAWVALRDCIEWMRARDMVTKPVILDHVAAVSCGIFRGVPVLDLDYLEDVEAHTDANFVMTGSGGIVEIQGTAEREPFTEAEFNQLLSLARAGIGHLVELQKLSIL